jgi:uncharacterized protein YutE (UPF0331/DUF86 family)
VPGQADICWSSSRAPARGEAVYLADADLRAATERRLQLAVQICIDIGAHLVSEINARAPADYADIFSSLSEAGQIDRALAERMARAAMQRNLLVHSYVDLDHRRIFDVSAILMTSRKLRRRARVKSA